ncbi:hypothetical protein [Hymenobacter coccineus]|uniref:Uncharacterized protein n=1 Tax=Hymenobacter coccineus TaxID=1908235 RepID=A0A1G1TL32_9BACT|nr:hypothetical protein [Hymenobacter coccineus]OGX91563.1 hypothetical protein BEN49_19280 [Hymenobacter coccineus]
MTRAALLHVLDHPTAIAPAEVRELEQLAQAFPYCQTAHLLLAKAAHDQGTMLAGQRLRRAATYAADRELLRRLIEQVVPAGAPTAEPESAPLEAAPAAPSAVPPQATPVAAGAPAATPIATEAEAVPKVAEATTEAVSTELVASPIVVLTPETSVPETSAVEALEGPAFEEQAPEASAAEAQATEAVDIAETGAPAPEAAINETVAVAELGAPAPEAALNEADSNEDAQPAGTPVATEEAPTLASDGAADAPMEADTEPAEALVDTPDALAPEPLPAPPAGGPDEPELPAVAPPIHPPEAASAARVEFELPEEPAPAAPMYELPGLVDEWAAAASTLALAPAAAAPLPATARVRPLTAADFTGDAELGYGLGGSSRLGFAVQLLNSWEADDQAATTGPAAALPPTGEFFAPDVLLLDHWAAHRPPEAPTSVDLINTFLRRQPRLTRPAMLPPSSGAQVDLSVRNARLETELASEGLAQILARQGKTARAIEIYERLMVKQPEKMAYFAAQIQQLQPPARQEPLFPSS